MRIRVGCEFVWETTAPVPMLMLVRPRADADHIAIYESAWGDPELAIHEYADLFGNNCWRLVAPERTSAVRYDAVVEIPDTPDPVVLHAALHLVVDNLDTTRDVTPQQHDRASDKLR